MPGARVAPLELDREVAVVLDRIPRHAQPAEGAGEAAVIGHPVEPAGSGLLPLREVGRRVEDRLLLDVRLPFAAVDADLGRADARPVAVGGVEVDRPPARRSSDTGASPLSFAVVVGAFGSIRNATDRVVSTLPSSSVERYWIVCRPSSSTVNGPVYCVHSSVPANRYSVTSTPEPPSLSVALSVTSTGDVYQSLSPSGSAGSSACVVRGGVVSSGLAAALATPRGRSRT